jgi:hypothetical protein
MKIFGVVREENKKSTRKKMLKIRLILSIICFIENKKKSGLN